MTTIRTTTTDKRSELLRYLQNLERLFYAYLDAINILSQCSILLALAMETRLLLIKLSQTAQRWSYHLPLFEFHDVDFNSWGEILRAWCNYMDKPALSEEYISYKPFVPSRNFLVDLYDALQASGESVRQYDQMTFEEYIKSGNIAQTALKTSYDQYRQNFEKVTLDQLGQIDEGAPGFVPLEKSEQVRELCYQQLLQLSTLMFRIGSMLNGAHPDDTYINLYERTIEQRCNALKRRVTSEVEQWLKDYKGDDIKTDAMIEFRVVKQDIENHLILKPLSNYLDFEILLQEQHASLGKFLYEHREELSNDQVALLTLVEAITKMELYQPIALHGITFNPTITHTDLCIPYLTDELSNNPIAFQKFKELLTDDLPSLGTKQHEATGGKKWGHLYEALKKEEVKVLKKETTANDFARAIGKILGFNETKVENIGRYVSGRYSKDMGKASIKEFAQRYKTIWDKKSTDKK